jgi:hypothetical protein
MSGRRSPPRAEPGSPGADGRGGFGCVPIANGFAGALTPPQGMVKMVHSGGAANSDHAASTRSVSTAALRLSQTKLSRNSNQIARGRIRKFESYMPSHAVWSPRRKMVSRSMTTGIIDKQPLAGPVRLPPESGITH